VTASASFSTNLPANIWLFVAAAYDGANVTLYQGTESNAVSLVSTTAAVASVNFGNSGALYVGNRQNLQRAFDGWLDDFRFYTGVGDATFVENVRLSALAPPFLTTQPSTNGIALTWPNGTLQSAPTLLGPWSDVPGAASPYSNIATGLQQFFRLR
jgi:hypothetical protein